MNRKVSTTVLALLVFAAIVEGSCRWIFPRIHGTAENLAAIASARTLLDRQMPLDPSDKQLQETVYNHGGSLGVSRSFASGSPREQIARRFSNLLSDSRHPAADRGASSDGLVVHCFGAFQLSLDQLPQGNGYAVFAVRDDTAVKPVSCENRIREATRR